MDENTTANNAPALNVAAITTFFVPPPTTTISLAKPFPDISKIKVFSRENFQRWQERIFGVLDLHGVAWVLVDLKDIENADGHMEIRFMRLNPLMAISLF
ncbi:RNA-directed DNA polymerase [Salix suchowensis]|nr:RNA-directed DNA polymerase [Salix suchowensis]